MRRSVLSIVTLIFLLCSVAARAHHGYATFFDPTERTIAIEGELESLLYANPHVIMKIRVANATVYTVTWQAASWVERNAGVTRSTFKTGDQLIVIGAPSRDPASREVTLVRELRRPRDQWSWRSTSRFAPPS
jgi:hypothetical protein